MKSEVTHSVFSFPSNKASPTLHDFPFSSPPLLFHTSLSKIFEKLVRKCIQGISKLSLGGERTETSWCWMSKSG